MSQSTLYDSQQTIKDMPDSMDYYTSRYEKQEFELKQERQDVSHFITPRVLPQQIAPKILPPTPIKRKRSMELDAAEEIEEMEDKKKDPFYFDDIECDELDSKNIVTKILFPPLIKRTSLVLFEVK